jgi:hypothetical protein
VLVIWFRRRRAPGALAVAEEMSDAIEQVWGGLPAVEHRDLMAHVSQPPDQRNTEETCAADDQGAHGPFPEAHEHHLDGRKRSGLGGPFGRSVSSVRRLTSLSVTLTPSPPCSSTLLACCGAADLPTSKARLSTNCPAALVATAASRR